ncbi:MAG: hypothetical protein Q4A60_06635 [Pasteurellaceae bacterium]|nr:hypothetical protein [Pasteurellaceae bacterium]
MSKLICAEHTYKVKCFQAEENMWRGYIYVDGKLLEKTPQYWTEQNCIDWLNKRIDFHNQHKGLNIPTYQPQEQQNAN